MSYQEVLHFITNLAHGSADPGLVGFEFTGLDYGLCLHALSPAAVDLRQLCWVSQPTPKQLDDNLVYFLECAKALDAPGAAHFPGEIETHNFGGARRGLRGVSSQPLAQQQQQQQQQQTTSNNDSGDSAITLAHVDEQQQNLHHGGDDGDAENNAAASDNNNINAASAECQHSLLLFTPDTLQPTKSCFMHHMLVQKWLHALQSQHRPMPLAVFDPQAVRRRFGFPVPTSQRCPDAMIEAFELLMAEKAGYRNCWQQVERTVLGMLERDAEVDMKKLKNVLIVTQPTKVL